MKRIVSLLLVLVMLWGVLCSCNDTDKNTNIPSDDMNTLISEDKPSDETNTPSDEDKPNSEVNKPILDQNSNDNTENDTPPSNLEFLSGMSCNGMAETSDLHYFTNEKDELILCIEKWYEVRKVLSFNTNDLNTRFTMAIINKLGFLISYKHKQNTRSFWKEVMR